MFKLFCCFFLAFRKPGVKNSRLPRDPPLSLMLAQVTAALVKVPPTWNFDEPPTFTT